MFGYYFGNNQTKGSTSDNYYTKIPRIYHFVVLFVLALAFCLLPISFTTKISYYYPFILRLVPNQMGNLVLVLDMDEKGLVLAQPIYAYTHFSPLHSGHGTLIDFLDG